MQQIFTIQ